MQDHCPNCVPRSRRNDASNVSPMAVLIAVATLLIGDEVPPGEQRRCKIWFGGCPGVNDCHRLTRPRGNLPSTFGIQFGQCPLRTPRWVVCCLCLAGVEAISFCFSSTATAKVSSLACT